MIRIAALSALWFLAGCTDLVGDDGGNAAGASDDACGRIAPTTVVDDVYEDGLLVDNRSLVLHTRESTILLAEAGTCREVNVGDARVGDRVGHDATQIAASYPGQAWPDTVVVHR